MSSHDEDMLTAIDLSSATDDEKQSMKERFQSIMKLLTKEHKEHIRSIEKNMVRSFSGEYYDLPEKTKNGTLKKTKREKEFKLLPPSSYMAVFKDVGLVTDPRYYVLKDEYDDTIQTIDRYGIDCGTCGKTLIKEGEVDKYKVGGATEEKENYFSCDICGEFHCEEHKQEEHKQDCSECDSEHCEDCDMGSISIPCYEEGENDSLDSSKCLFCPHCDCKIRDDGRNADIHFCPDCDDEVYIKH